MYYKSVSAIAGGGKTAVLLNTFSKGLARCSGSNWVFFPDPNWLCAPGANNGPYIEPLNNALPLRGSSNQNILLFDLTHESRYADYLNTEKKRIQNFYFDDQTVSVGIHDVAFKDDLNATLKELKVREKTNAGSKMAQ